MTYKAPAELVRRLGRVAVFYGGTAAERAVSLESGAAVAKALVNAGIDAFLVDTKRGMHDIINNEKFDRVFLALHGRGGEDGTIQGFLASLNIPFTGSGVLASALAMDKHRTKQVWQSEGLLVADGICLPYQDNMQSLLTDTLLTKIESMGYPFSVKPATEGSSIGVFKVSNRAELFDAVKQSAGHGAPLMIEKWIEGKEFTVGILGKEALPVIGLATDHEFYDYDAKYIANDTRYLLPSGLSEEAEAEIKSLALRAFYAVNCQGWGRVDFIRADNGQFYLLEINTIPGMTSHSLVPMAAAAKGISFEELVVRILENSL